MEQTLIQFVESLEQSFKLLELESGKKGGVTRLTLSQIQYINVIRQYPGRPISEVAQKLGYSRASATAAINKLVDLGYVVKTRSTADGRVFYVSLTDAANQLMDAKLSAIKQYSQHILTVLDQEETRIFEKILQKILSKKLVEADSSFIEKDKRQ